MLWVEATGGSDQAEGDSTITVRWRDDDEDDDEHCRVIRMTSIAIEIEGRDWPDGDWEPIGGLITSSAYPPDLDLTAERVIVPGPQYVHRFRVTDPRLDRPTGITIENVTLPFVSEPELNVRVTNEFVVTRPGEAALGNLPPVIGIEATHTEAEYLYNPGGKIKDSGKIKDADPEVRRYAKALMDIPEEMRQANWVPDGYTPNSNPSLFSGAFGTEVHRRVAERLSGRARWLFEVYVDLDTRRVLSIVAAPSGVPLTERTIAADAILLKKGQTIAVGETFDIDKVETAFELKTSARARIGVDQLNKYGELMQGKDFAVSSVFTKWVPGKGWQPHEVAQLKWTMTERLKVSKGQVVAGIGIVATTACVWNLIHFESDDDEFQDLARDMQNLRGQFENGFFCGKEIEYKLRCIEVARKLTAYMGRYSDGISAIDSNAIAGLMSYDIIGTDIETPCP